MKMLKPSMTTNPPQSALTIVKRLQEAGHQAVFAGGCVRDALLGRKPKDWDVATSAHPDEIEALFAQTYDVGRQFGIIVVVLDGMEYEVATFRGDGAYSDGRRPDSIQFVSMREDVLRRDFTINALLYDPILGKLHDFVHGQEDMQNRILRTVGEPERRFEEDKLRLLRAIRFTANLDFTMEDATWNAVCNSAANIKMVSQERIFAELDRMLTEGHSMRAFDLLKKSGLLAFVLPELDVMAGVPQPPQFHPEGDVWQHTLKILDGFDKSLADGRFNHFAEKELRQLAWAVLLHDIGKPPTFADDGEKIRFYGHDTRGAEMSRAVLQRLRTSTELMDVVAYLVAEHMVLPAFPEMRQATRFRRMGHPAFPLLLELFRLDCEASFGDTALYYEIKDNAFAEYLRQPQPMKPPVSGHDLIAMGFKPGPLFSKIIHDATDANLEHPFASHESALQWVKDHFEIPRMADKSVGNFNNNNSKEKK